MKGEKASKARVASLLLFLAILSIMAHGQVVKDSSKNQDVIVSTWRVGEDRISPETYHLTLDQDVSEYEIRIENISKTRHFRLQLTRGFTQTPLRSSINCWFVSLKEITRDKNPAGSYIGSNLLTVEGPGVGDSFSKEDWASSFCALEPPKKLFDERFYAIKMRRTFLIEKFKLTVQASDYFYNPTKNRLEKLNLEIEFKNQN